MRGHVMPRPLRRLALAILVAGSASVLFSAPAWAPPPPMRPPPPVGIKVHPGNGRAVVRWQPETNDFFPWFPDRLRKPGRGSTVPLQSPRCDSVDMHHQGPYEWGPILTSGSIPSTRRASTARSSSWVSGHRESGSRRESHKGPAPSCGRGVCDRHRADLDAVQRVDEITPPNRGRAAFRREEFGGGLNAHSHLTANSKIHLDSALIRADSDLGR